MIPKEIIIYIIISINLIPHIIITQDKCKNLLIIKLKRLFSKYKIMKILKILLMILLKKSNNPFNHKCLNSIHFKPLPNFNSKIFTLLKI